jgi:hypothetical protein
MAPNSDSLAGPIPKIIKLSCSNPSFFVTEAVNVNATVIPLTDVRGSVYFIPPFFSFAG